MDEFYQDLWRGVMLQSLAQKDDVVVAINKAVAVLKATKYQFDTETKSP